MVMSVTAWIVGLGTGAGTTVSAGNLHVGSGEGGFDSVLSLSLSTEIVLCEPKFGVEAAGAGVMKAASVVVEVATGVVKVGRGSDLRGRPRVFFSG